MAKKQRSKSAADNKINGQEDGENFFSFIDKFYQAQLAHLTLGISPAALSTSQFAWLAQWAQSPGTQLQIGLYPWLHAGELMHRLVNGKVPGAGHDVRFQHDLWQEQPWKLWAELFLQWEHWSLSAATDVPGLPEHVGRTLAFRLRQLFDALSPSNFVLTNPELFAQTLKTNGQNLWRGLTLAIQDMLEKLSGSSPAGVENFIPGIQVAATPGKVVYQNHLIELIQYQPQTEKVYKEPILIIPAWIMKYYILDLLPENSLVNWLTQQGHTVFIISWRNPSQEDRHLGMDDYYRLGAMAALDVISQRIPNSKIHLMGYCLGGTLAYLTAAAMAKQGDNRLKSLSLLAAQADFSEAGELLLFITKSEVSFLQNMMWDQGYLDTKQMAGTFQMLRSYDLIWSKMVQDYMHGTQRGMIALLAWNADATRMPYKMHSEYLEKLYLNNDFSKGRFSLEGQTIAPQDIQLDSFVVSTEKDHVAPWKSVYKTHLLLPGEIRFVLTNGGHNAGIVSEPGHPNRSYHIATRSQGATYLPPEHWLEQAKRKTGSWWTDWHQWLVDRSSAKMVPPPPLEPELPDAPGTYVLQK